MNPKFTLEKRIAAELKSYDGHMCFYADDLKGNVVEIGADEDFETASTIKTFILVCLFDQIKQGKANLNDTLVYKENHLSLIHIWQPVRQYEPYLPSNMRLICLPLHGTV